ncbi:MAG: hypothetical protein GX477_00740 [Clostridiaceae bacterium]|nr:hypothetical protein [Clostridiaceae bacterium]
MSGFYSSMIFIGMLLVLVCLVLILIDRKNVSMFKKSAEEKIQELTGIIADAEQMIEELNRFSGYILEQVDLRNEELNRSIREAEQKIDALAEKACLTGEGRDITEKKSPVREAVNGKAIPVNGAPGAGSDEKADSAGICVAPRPAGSVAAAYSRNSVCISPGKKEKVIQFNKYQEVLRLSKEGMDEIEIAKNLNMGKGEVELIIGLRG